MLTPLSMPGRNLPCSPAPMILLSRSLCQSICKKKVIAAFDGGPISADGGVLLLAGADRRLDLIDTLAAIIPDHRDPALITHTMSGSFTQRYVKRHGSARKDAKIRRLCGFLFPHLSLRFQADFGGWNADRIPEQFIGEGGLPSGSSCTPRRAAPKPRLALQTTERHAPRGHQSTPTAGRNFPMARVV